MLEDKLTPTSAGNDPEHTPEFDTGGGLFAGLVLTVDETKFDVIRLLNPILGTRGLSYRTRYQAGAMVPYLTLATMSHINYQQKNHKT